MTVIGILCYLTIPMCLWVAFAVFWIAETQESLITNTAILSTTFAMITGPFWILYVVYLAMKLIPALDKLAKSGQPSERAYPDNWLARCISLNNYAGNLMSARVRSKNDLAIDLRKQPVAIRLALKVHVYWMCLGALAILVGFLLLTISQ